MRTRPRRSHARLNKRHAGIAPMTRLCDRADRGGWACLIAGLSNNPDNSRKFRPTLTFTPAPLYPDFLRSP
ncbi:MAG TPA: hypothetical protein PKC88_10600, partial [Plasticicumulans sp.]|nr:hypothetical protein [Plasticicumulans sp.]